jgi:hypothetical protein
MIRNAEHIELAKKYGPHLATREIWGQKVCSDIKGLLAMGYTVEVSFKGMDSASPSFLDEAFGKLVEEYDLNFLKKHLSITNISDHYRMVLNKAIIRRNGLKGQAH